MSAIFLKMLNMSFTASGLILAVIAIRFILKKSPKGIICAMWGLVALRLVCPYTLVSKFSLVRSDQIVSNTVLSEVHPEMHITTGLKPIDTAVATIISEHSAAEEIGFDRSAGEMLSNLSIFWICGMLGMMLYVVIVNVRLKKKLDEAILKQDHIYYSDYVRSPFVYGIFSPKIYLPAEMNDEHLKYVIAHEEMHLKHKDNLWKLLGFLILTIHWFNALVWAAFILFCKDIEYACDEAVIRDYSMSERKEYSESLLSCATAKKMIYAYPLSFGSLDVRKRVKAVLTYNRPKCVVMIISFLMLGLVGVCYLTTAPDNKKIKSLDMVLESVDREKDAIDIKKMLLHDYGSNIAYASVLFRSDENDIETVNIFMINKNEICDMEEQSHIKLDIAEVFDVEPANIYIQCILDSDA